MIQEIKGWHVLMALLGFFSVTISVNAYFITMALQTSPGEYQKKSYLQGLKYNEVIAARAEQTAAGWTATLETRTRPDRAFEIDVMMRDARGEPLSTLRLTGLLRRPAVATQDRHLTFEHIGSGRYRALSADVGPGHWQLEFDATGGAPFHAEKTLWVR